MRKEIIGIILFFLVIFTLISLLSYSPEDPSINNARATGDIHNIFGTFGAHVGGALIALFGIGAFWLPILLLLLSVQFFGKNPEAVILQRIAGGVLLIITTGSLIAFYSNHLAIFGSRFSSGGIVGIPLKSFLEKYTNTSGGVIILLLLWLIGFILTTGFSLVRFYKRSLGTGTRFGEKLKTFLIKYKERREKNRKRHRAIKAKKVRPPQEETIRAVKPMEAGEILGFLPGDMYAKVNPYLRPLYDALHDLMDGRRVQRHIENDVIEILPLAFVRGRTLDKAFIILDEAQNCTVSQMKTFLTRLGPQARLLVTGDITQNDLEPGQKSGLADALERLTLVQGIEFVRLTKQDIVRHPIVGRILVAYERELPSTVGSEDTRDAK